MAYDAHKNFAYSTVATAPSPATSGTSLVVGAGDGTKFPTPPFNATVWPINVQPSATNAEIVRVTAISTDTLTITRAQESSTARSVIVGDQIAATITAKTLQDAELAIGHPMTSGTSGSVLFVDSSGNIAQNNTKFNWDDTNQRLGVNVTGNTAALQIKPKVVGDISLYLPGLLDQTAALAQIDANYTAGDWDRTPIKLNINSAMLLWFRHYHVGGNDILDLFSDINWIRFYANYTGGTASGRMDFTAGSIYMNGTLYPQGNTEWTRTGDATSTATQKDSWKVLFQTSEWNGSTAVSYDSGLFSQASTTVNQQMQLVFIVGWQYGTGYSAANEKMVIRSDGKVGINATSPNSILQVGGAIATAFSTKTANYTLTETDSVIAADASGGAFTVTLPTSVGITGRAYTVKKIDSSTNSVTVVTTSSQTIDGATTQVITGQYTTIEVVSNGADWLII